MSASFAFPLIVGVGAFIIGWIAAKISSYFSRRAATFETPDQHHQIRSLEASLRVAQKKADESIEKFTTIAAELDDLCEKHEAAEQLLNRRDVELCDQKQVISDETAKVRSLRVELADRAEQKIRAEYTARQAETELSVIQAGSAAMSDEVDRLASEHETMSNRLVMYETGSFPARPKESDDADESELSPPEEDFLPDC